MSGGFGISVGVETLLFALRGVLLHVGDDRGVVSIGLLGSGVGDGKSIRITHADNRITVPGGLSCPLTPAPSRSGRAWFASHLLTQADERVIEGLSSQLCTV